MVSKRIHRRTRRRGGRKSVKGGRSFKKATFKKSRKTKSGKSKPVRDLRKEVQHLDRLRDFLAVPVANRVGYANTPTAYYPDPNDILPVELRNRMPRAKRGPPAGEVLTEDEGGDYFEDADRGWFLARMGALAEAEELAHGNRRAVNRERERQYHVRREAAAVARERLREAGRAARNLLGRGRRRSRSHYD